MTKEYRDCEFLREHRADRLGVSMLVVGCAVMKLM